MNDTNTPEELAAECKRLARLTPMVWEACLVYHIDAMDVVIDRLQALASARIEAQARADNLAETVVVLTSGRTHMYSQLEALVSENERLASLAAGAQAGAGDPLFLLHTGKLASDGEQDEWDIEADSGVRVDEFCAKHPGQAIGLYARPAPAQAAEVPLGWKLVPEEPTDDMVIVGGEAFFDAARTEDGETEDDQGAAGCIYTAMLAAAPPAPAPEARKPLEWQPLETAPRDGTLILLGRVADIEADQDAVCTPGCWHDGYEDGVDYMGHDSGFMDSAFQTFSCPRTFGAEQHRSTGDQPTHWMPLPAAPAGITTTTEG